MVTLSAPPQRVGCHINGGERTLAKYGGACSYWSHYCEITYPAPAAGHGDVNETASEDGALCGPMWPLGVLGFSWASEDGFPHSELSELLAPAKCGINRDRA